MKKDILKVQGCKFIWCFVYFLPGFLFATLFRFFFLYIYEANKEKKRSFIKEKYHISVVKLYYQIGRLKLIQALTYQITSY